MGLETPGFLICHHPPSPSPSPSSPTTNPYPTTKTCPCRSLHSSVHSFSFPYNKGSLPGLGWQQIIYLLERPCASQQGASMLLRKGGFLRRAGEGVRPPPPRRPSLCPPDLDGKRSIERTLKNTFEASESGIRLFSAHLL